MKKKQIVPIVAVAALFFASCDSKLCYCYETTSQGVYEQEVYTSTDTPCGAMSTSSRGCVEQHERMDPGSIAYK
jgi:hypothetical protein